MYKNLKIAGVSLFIIMFFGFVPSLLADHSWGGYHWARTTSSFDLKLGDNLTESWDSYLTTTSVDWSVSSVLNTFIVPGTALRHKSTNRDCSPTSGLVEICNKAYGNTGWLGIAQVWVSGTHITQGVAKLNDTYFNKSPYNTPAWKNLVMCQEVAHTFGLGHQDEVFNNTNLGTCMDYTNDPDGGLGGFSANDPSNERPNQHDYDQLVTIYSLHSDSSTTVSASAPTKNGNNANGNGSNADNPSDWGKAIKKDASGKDSLFEKDLGNGKKVITHVFWAE